VPPPGSQQTLDAVSPPPNGRRMAGARAGHGRSLCRVPPGQHSAKGTCCRVPLFAEGRHSATLGYAVWQMFAECSLPGTRQTMSLPSARVLALGKGRDTRQRPRHSANLGFPVVIYCIFFATSVIRKYHNLMYVYLCYKTQMCEYEDFWRFVTLEHCNHVKKN